MKDELKKQGQRGENCDQRISCPSPPPVHTYMWAHVSTCMAHSHIHIHLAAAQSPGKSVSGMQNWLLKDPEEILESMLNLGKLDAKKRNILDIAEIYLLLPLHFIAYCHPDPDTVSCNVTNSTLAVNDVGLQRTRSRRDPLGYHRRALRAGGDGGVHERREGREAPYGRRDGRRHLSAVP